MSQVGKVGRIVVGHHHFRMSPLDEILRQYLRTVAHYLVGYQQTAFRQYASAQCRLTSGSSTEVEHHHRFVHILTKHPLHEHGRGLLYIVATSMKKRVESKGRTIFKIKSYRRCPRNRFTHHRLIGFRTIGTDADRCFDT